MIPWSSVRSSFVGSAGWVNGLAGGEGLGRFQGRVRSVIRTCSLRVSFQIGLCGSMSLFIVKMGLSLRKVKYDVDFLGDE